MRNLAATEIDQVSGGLDGLIPISWSLPAGPGGSDVTLYGIGYTSGGTTIGFGSGDDSTFGVEVKYSF